jgi:hypothetical protein
MLSLGAYYKLEASIVGRHAEKVDFTVSSLMKQSKTKYIPIDYVVHTTSTVMNVDENRLSEHTLMDSNSAAVTVLERRKLPPFELTKLK